MSTLRATRLIYFTSRDDSGKRPWLVVGTPCKIKIAVWPRETTVYECFTVNIRD